MRYKKMLDDAIIKLASLWPEDGELLASIFPSDLVTRAHDEIVRLRATTAITVISEVVPHPTMQFEINDPLSQEPPKDEWDGVEPPPGCPCDWPSYGMAGACQCCHELWPRLKKAEAKLSHLVDWSHQFGEHLCPRHRADTYGEGVHQMKEEVSNILSRK